MLRKWLQLPGVFATKRGGDRKTFTKPPWKIGGHLAPNYRQRQMGSRVWSPQHLFLAQAVPDLPSDRGRHCPPVCSHIQSLAQSCWSTCSVLESHSRSPGLPAVFRNCTAKSLVCPLRQTGTSIRCIRSKQVYSRLVH